MIDEVVTADSAAMEGEQVSVEAADNGDEVHGVLDAVGVGCCFLGSGLSALIRQIPS